MQSIVFIVPYFLRGELPPIFYYWLKSVEYNPDIDFLIFTDCERPSFIPKNVYWEVMQFEEFKAILDDKIGFCSSLCSPYKLCDIRPAYGDIFYDRIKEYDFWGWCDVDLVFGNIRNFITETILHEYDKIGELGHCVLVRNSDKMRTMYKQSIDGVYPYRIIFSCKENLSFDEGGNGNYGFPAICSAYGVKAMWKRWFTDVYTGTFEFRHKQYIGNTPYYREFIYAKFDRGQLSITNKNDGSTFESMYIHFQGRKMNGNNNVEKSFYMIPNCFVNDISLDEYGCSMEAEKFDFLQGMKRKKRNSIRKKIRILFFLLQKGLILKKGWLKYCC